MEPECRGLKALTDAGNCSVGARKARPETLRGVLQDMGGQDGFETSREWNLMGADLHKGKRPHTSIFLSHSTTGNGLKEDAQGWTDGI